uniref:Uncharacterized protein n=1 Tax=Anguilla anguilla TaxID=7936 RepID=A0A0E9T381_ANGAN
MAFYGVVGGKCEMFSRAVLPTIYGK